MKFSTIKGMHDIGPPEIEVWHRVEKAAREVFENAAFFELRPPVLEEEALFSRGIGTTTDIVEKEMYAFEDRNGKRISLRPEGTASIVRAYIERYAAPGGQYQRFYYWGPMFRHERPQKGRFRQFYQIGAEIFASSHPYTDAELIALASQLFKKLGLSGVKLSLNSLGCSGCRSSFRQALLEFLTPLKNELCEECQGRLGRNPLRVLDCKKENCQKLTHEAPSGLEYLCQDCLNHFEQVQLGLSRFQVEYTINPRLVRGLDYYVRTAFEFVSEGLGAQNAVAGGGRYDGLVEELGGPPTPAIGFAIGVERLVSLLSTQETLPDSKKIFFACLGAKAQEALLPLLQQLRQLGFWVSTDYEPKSLKSLLRQANHWQVDWAVIVGDQELEKGIVQVKEMKTQGAQKEIPLLTLIQYFQEARRV